MVSGKLASHLQLAVSHSDEENKKIKSSHAFLVRLVTGSCGKVVRR